MLAIKKTVILWLLALIMTHVPPETQRVQAQSVIPAFPVISRLDVRDLGFSQYLSDVENARRRIFNRNRNGETPEALAEALTIYAYIPAETDTVFSLAARCNIPYAALATLNHIAHPGSFEEGLPLLLPSVPGVFIPENPESDLEQILASSRGDSGGIPLTITREGRQETFFFIPGADFTPTERTFFLNFNFRFPLRSYRISSPFGMRRNPVTGNMRLHEGLDLAAPAGTEVFATREGVVTDLGEDPIYGKYIVIRHGDNWASLYGHLSVIGASLNGRVNTGSLIGRVGSTGQSTGPHLHFELRRNGQAQDPGKLLFQAP